MNISNTIDTVIFDLDGTLLDTLADLADATNHFLKKYGLTTHTRAEIRSMVGNGVYKLMERAMPGGKSNPDYADCMTYFAPYYKEHMMDQTVPYDGIIEMLETLKNHGFKLAVVSNKFDAAVKELCHIFFSDFISVAIGENEAAGIAKKPAPDTVFQAMRELGSSPETCIYVGDSEVDLQTAANAGIPCISVSWGFKDIDFLKKNGAQIIISDPSELIFLFVVNR